MLPIEKDTDETMREIAWFIHQKTSEDYGFMVLVFPFSDEEKTAHYISNCDRGDMISALREKADVLERGLDIQNVNNKQ